jgi:hypothetical protein
MAYSSHTAVAQSTVNADASHMAIWPSGVEYPVSLLVENIRTDKPDYIGDFGAEWDEAPEELSVVTLTMTNGAKLVLKAEDPTDCIGPEFEWEGDWNPYLKDDKDATIEYAVQDVLLDALDEARDDALKPYRHLFDEEGSAL